MNWLTNWLMPPLPRETVAQAVARLGDGWQRSHRLRGYVNAHDIEREMQRREVSNVVNMILTRRKP